MSPELSSPPIAARPVPARLTLFGHPPTPADLELLPRGRAWRLGRAAVALGLALLLAPAAFLVPPHAPWGLGVLAAGGFFARRRWTERFSVAGLRAECPRCGRRVDLPSGTRLRVPHTLSCDGCRHQPVLRIEPEELEALERVPA